MTPYRLRFLIERKAERSRQERRDLAEQIAALRADLINFSMCHPPDMVRIADLLPWVKDQDAGVQTKRARKRRMSAKQRAEIANSWRMFLSAQP
jgi:hypothetical protein